MMLANIHRRRGWFTGLVTLSLAWGAAAAGASEEAPRTSPPRMNPAGGAYRDEVKVAITCASPGAVVRYTVDGAEPAETSPVFAEGLKLSRTTLVRARAFAPDAAPSAAVAEVYTLLEEDAARFTSNLPLLVVNSFGTNFAREQKAPAGLQIFGSGSAGDRPALAGAGTAVFSGTGLLNVRGRASLRYPKSSYTVKLTDGEGDPEPARLLGMPAESDWVLYAPYPDKTLMRDVLAYELSRAMGHWAPRTRFVEVFVNLSGARLSLRDYVGVYVLEERIKRDKHRVNIAKLKPEDDTEPRITGGYIFKKDHVGFGGMGIGGGDLGGFPAYATSSGTRAGYPTGPGGFPGDPRGFQAASRSGSRSSSSSSSSSNRRVRGVVTNYVGRPAPRELARQFGEVIMRDEDEEERNPVNEENFKTPQANEFYFVEPEPDELTAVQKAWLKRHLDETEAAIYGEDFRDPGKGYAAYLDPASFVDYHLLVETTKNVDGFRFSVFFHKERGGRIKAVPIWDWNLSFGNANGKQGWLPEWWLWPQLDDKEYSWYRRLFEDPDFGQRYVDRWTELRSNVLATATVAARIDELAALLQESQKRNFERWPILGRPVNPNYFVGATYDEEVAFLKKYFTTRLDWIAKQFPPVPSAVMVAARLELSATEAGEIYYTLDGTDPRAPGGGVAAAAQRYDGPLPKVSGPVFTRTKQGNRWSGPRVAGGGA